MKLRLRKLRIRYARGTKVFVQIPIIIITGRVS